MEVTNMDIGDIVSLIGVAVATASLMFGIMKWRDAAIHARIKEVQVKAKEDKAELKEDISEIKENYAHRSEMNQSVKNVENMMRDMKQEQHRMAQRMDEFLKWIMQIQTGKKGEE